MKFSEDFIERVRDANNIVDLISQHTQLRPMAGGFMGRCPFPDHQEKTPSFSVSESKQVYNCFGCHKKGNLFRFVQEFMGLSFPEAVEYLANRAHIAMPEESSTDAHLQDQVLRQKKSVLKINKLALRYFTESFKNLSKDHPVRIYAQEKRGLNSQTFSEFQIGYAPKEWDGLVRFIRQHGESLSLAEEARLIKKRSAGDQFGDGHIDIFRDRLMFPIFNTMNEPVAFGGRIIGAGEPKYLNSGETPVFNKGKILYGLSQTARFVRSEDQVLVVEGYMDLVSLYQNGLRNAVAPMGTALTFDQCRILARMTKNVVVLFDGDEAGQRAAERSLSLLLSAGAHPKGLILPDSMDPDDFVKTQGPQVLSRLLANSPDLFSMVLGIWLRGYRGEASEKVKLSDLLSPIFASVQDPRLRKLYLQESAAKLKVDEIWLRDAIKSQNQGNSPAPAMAQNQSQANSTSGVNDKNSRAVSTENSIERVSLKGASNLELTVLRTILKNTSNYEYLNKSQGIQYIHHPGILSLLEKAANAYRQGPEKFDKLAGLLSSFVDQPDLLFEAVGKASMKPAEKPAEKLNEKQGENPETGAENPNKDFDLEIQNEKQQETDLKVLVECVGRLRDQFLKAQAERLAADIKLQATPEKLEQLMSIQRDRLAINKEP